MAKNEKSKVKYVLNESFVSHEINGTVFPRKHFIALTEDELAKFLKHFAFASLVKTGEFIIKDEIDDSMKTTEEKLQDAKQETESIKQEALDALAAKDAEIKALKAKLAELGAIEQEATEQDSTEQEAKE